MRPCGWCAHCDSSGSGSGQQKTPVSSICCTRVARRGRVARSGSGDDAPADYEQPILIHALDGRRANVRQSTWFGHLSQNVRCLGCNGKMVRCHLHSSPCHHAHHPIRRNSSRRSSRFPGSPCSRAGSCCSEWPLRRWPGPPRSAGWW
ncbi:hypothetical protein YT1_3498 [Rhodococcus ruber]|nr:hypothetical protein YT1_3498 [Rhodococcus ruber]